MTLETEAVLDRRRLRRSLSLWRVLGVAASLVALLTLGYVAAGSPRFAQRDQIARITIEGVITESREQLALIKRIGEAKHVRAVIVQINSPGGTATGGEALFEALRRLASIKPVVAQFGTVATSAAYMAALAADRIFARANTITGSIGVIWQWPDLSQLLERLGIRMNAITSGPLKANPNPYQPLDGPGRQVVEQMVDEAKRFFFGLVAERRGIATSAIQGLEAGRVFTGQDALKQRLVDEIGAETEVVRWLEQSRGVAKGLRIVDWQERRGVQVGPFRLALAALGRAIGLGEAVAEETARVLAEEPRLATLRLDGLLAIWVP